MKRVWEMFTIFVGKIVLQLKIYSTVQKKSPPPTAEFRGPQDHPQIE